VYTQSRRVKVGVYPEGPVSTAHTMLGERRALGAAELRVFSVLGQAYAQGPLTLDGLGLESRAAVEAELADVDPRLDRVVAQQHLRLGVVRRDVRYQMCGTEGTLALSGRPLAVAWTPNAEHPIQRRRILWPVLVVTLGILGLFIAALAGGSAEYFEASNTIVARLWMLAVLASVPWVGGLLRAWRPLIRIRGLRKVEFGLGVGWALSLLAIALVGVSTRPTLGEVEEALAGGDLTRARIVVDALLERQGEGKEDGDGDGDGDAIIDIEDRVLLAEAEAAQGARRLGLLDSLTVRGGAQSATASAAARVDRVARIQELVSRGRDERAIAAIDSGFGERWRDDPEIAETRAQAEELRVPRCSDDICRFVARRAAHEAHATRDRGAVAGVLRQRLFEGLAVRADHHTRSPAQRLRASDEIVAFAELILASEVEDEELRKAANSAKVQAARERAGVAALGADIETLEALFPGRWEGSADLRSVSLADAQLFFELDKEGACRAVYVVGPAGHRELDGSDWSAEHLLSQVFGTHVSLRRPEGVGAVSSKWREGKTKIVVRWKGGVPIELRVGKVRP